MITIITIVILIIDICSKIIVTKYLGLGKSVKIINDILYLTHVRNTGAAWSMFDGNKYFVLIVSAVIIIGFIMYLLKNRPNNNIEKTVYGFILGGALGNFINRCVKGYVTDFIDVKILKYDYPIFNLADMFIVIGVIIFVIYTWRCNNGNKSKR